MRKSKFSESQIAGILSEVEAGLAVADAARKYGISPATFYQWRSKYGGMNVSDMQRLREVEQENARLKRMYADLSLDHSILKDLLIKKILTPVQRRAAVAWAQEDSGLSERRSCTLISQPRVTHRRVPADHCRDDSAAKSIAWGAPQWQRQWGCEGRNVNHKRTERLYRQHGLSLRRPRRRRLPDRAR